MKRGHKGRTDANHAAVLEGLRRAGVVAWSLAGVGAGMPDILCARAGETWLLEVKAGNKPLTAQERRFALLWPGRYAVVRSVDEALAVVGVRWPKS